MTKETCLSITHACVCRLREVTEDSLSRLSSIKRTYNARQSPMTCSTAKVSTVSQHTHYIQFIYVSANLSHVSLGLNITALELVASHSYVLVDELITFNFSWSRASEMVCTLDLSDATTLQWIQVRLISSYS